jgi:hypothetical protein
MSNEEYRDTYILRIGVGSKCRQQMWPWRSDDGKASVRDRIGHTLNTTAQARDAPCGIFESA